MEPIKLLVLSAKPEIREEIARFFAGHEIVVDYAEDHIQAVSRLAKTPYKGLVVEDGLFGVPGTDFSRRLKSKLPGLTTLLVVMKKGVKPFQDYVESKDVDGVIAYPWEFEPAKRAVQKLFLGRYLTEEASIEEGRYVLDEVEDQERLDSDVVKVVIKGIEDLPPLPDVVQKILNIVNDEGAGAKDLARIINVEPSMTAKILKIANSSFYGLKQQVTTISHAVVILGFNEVKNLVLGYSIFSNLLSGNAKERKTSLDFWRHNIACGVAARVIGERVGYKNPEELFVVGLLHDIGKTIFYDYFTDQYRQVVQGALNHRKPLCVEEKERLGLTHAEVGFWLAKHWNLPAIIRDGIRFHDAPSLAKKSSDPYTPMLAAIVYYADNLSKLLEIGNAGDPFVSDILPPQPLTSLDQKGLVALCDTITSQVKVFEQSLGIFSEETWRENQVDKIKTRRLFIIDDDRGVSPLETILGVRKVAYKRLPLSRNVFLDMLSPATDILLLRLREDAFYPKFMERLYRENPDPPPVIAFTQEPMLSDRGRGVYYYRVPFHIRELWDLLRLIANRKEGHDA